MPTPHIIKTGFIFKANCLLFIKKDNQFSLPNELEIEIIKPFFQRQHTLGEINHQFCFCAELISDTLLDEDMITIPLRKAFEILGTAWYAAITKAFSVINWDRNHQFCGHCGHTTVHKTGSFERLCQHCGLTFYPRISPSMIVLIKKGEQLLMARSPHFPPGTYGLVAGFVEIGESIEDAVHREVKEEVGITIKNLHYFSSQPWPFPDSLMIGFTADYDSGDIVIDNDEIEAAGWYNFDQLPGRPSTSMSIASQLIDHFIAEQTRRSIK